MPPVPRLGWDLNCQGWGRHPRRSGVQASREEAGGGVCGQDPSVLVVSWTSPAQPLVSPQILGLTFAMTMYCQVVKADTYCA